jgi:hypothetical protein
VSSPESRLAALIPEVTHDQRLRNNLVHFGAFVGGIALIVLTGVLLEA